MFWCLVRLSTGALCGGLYANPLEMAIQSSVACSEAKDDGLLVSCQLMEPCPGLGCIQFCSGRWLFFLLWIRVFCFCSVCEVCGLSEVFEFCHFLNVFLIN